MARFGNPNYLAQAFASGAALGADFADRVERTRLLVQDRNDRKAAEAWAIEVENTMGDVRDEVALARERLESVMETEAPGSPIYQDAYERFRAAGTNALNAQMEIMASGAVNPNQYISDAAGRGLQALNMRLEAADRETARMLDERRVAVAERGETRLGEQAEFEQKMGEEQLALDKRRLAGEEGAREFGEQMALARYGLDVRNADLQAELQQRGLDIEESKLGMLVEAHQFEMQQQRDQAAAMLEGHRKALADLDRDIQMAQKEGDTETAALLQGRRAKVSKAYRDSLRDLERNEREIEEMGKPGAAIKSLVRWGVENVDRLKNAGMFALSPIGATVYKGGRILGEVLEETQAEEAP